MRSKYPKPILLSVCLYSLLVIQIFFFAILFLVIFKFDLLEQLRESFSSNSIPFTIWLYLAIAFSLASTYSIIQMIRRKLHAVIIFHVVSALLVTLLVLSSPIEWVNIIFVILINYILAMYYSWFLKKDILSVQEDSAEELDI